MTVGLQDGGHKERKHHLHLGVARSGHCKGVEQGSGHSRHDPWDCRRTAEKRPGVVDWGSMGRQSYGSPISRVWVFLQHMFSHVFFQEHCQCKPAAKGRLRLVSAGLKTCT